MVMVNLWESLHSTGEPMGSDPSTVKDNARIGTKNATVRWILQTLIFVLLFGLSLFVSAGQWDWPMAWAYLGIFTLSQIIIGIFLVPTNPKLVAERTQLKSSPKAQWDRPLVGIATVFGPVSMLIVAGLDRRLEWTLLVPDSIQLSALGIVTLGSLLSIWAMVSNWFFYGRVRVEKEQGHNVANSGPYQAVRHPGYAGAIVFNLAVPLLFDSMWAFIPAVVIVLVLILRTALEDHFLMDELTGYKNYAQQVQYRLIPGIW
jgi:protein-S-isoprenylcysteine O-methyltransferase Ste14